MADLFPVQVRAPHLPVAGDRPVVFHGVNKSGSLAMTEVMRGSYYTARRAHEFFSHYHHIPRRFEDLVELMAHSTGPRFFVAHYLYRGVELPPDALLVSQVRHPLPRALSVHGWLKRGHERKHGTTDGWPDLESWLRRKSTGSHSQVAQFAIGFPPDRRKTTMSPETMHDMAIENLERDFAWVGLAEHFEESIFALAHICGLPAVPPWRRDTRNRWRRPLEEVDEQTVELIHETYAHDLRFYEHVVKLFRQRTDAIDFGPSLGPYQEACSSEYGERLFIR